MQEGFIETLQSELSTLEWQFYEQPTTQVVKTYAWKMGMLIDAITKTESVSSRIQKTKYLYDRVKLLAIRVHEKEPDSSLPAVLLSMLLDTFGESETLRRDMLQTIKAVSPAEPPAAVAPSLANMSTTASSNTRPAGGTARSTPSPANPPVQNTPVTPPSTQSTPSSAPVQRTTSPSAQQSPVNLTKPSTSPTGSIQPPPSSAPSQRTVLPPAQQVAATATSGSAGNAQSAPQPSQRKEAAQTIPVPPASYQSSQRRTSRLDILAEKPGCGCAVIFALVALVCIITAVLLTKPNFTPYTTKATNTIKAVSTAKATNTAKTTPKPTTSPVPLYPQNGQIIIMPAYERVCPLTIVADSTTNYYIYLKYQYPPIQSSTDRTSIDSYLGKLYNAVTSGDMAFFVEAGSTVNIDVPIGVYKFYYAAGETFYGKKFLFGSDTSRYSAKSVLSFYSYGNRYMGHTITLKSVINGNFDTSPISESEFPKSD